MILSGSPLDYHVAFWGGVLVSFTPCIYPLIPVTAGYIGVNACGSQLRGFLLSLIYVSGLAVTYSILGLIASLTGRLFGSISSHPLTYFFFGVLIIFFGLNMSGMFHLALPQIIKSPRRQAGNKSFISVFILGLSSGLVASPCVTPVLVSILSYIAASKKVIYGMTLLLVFGYGMGLVLIIAGTFSSLLAGLPKSGRWMVYIQRTGAFLLILAGIYFIFTGIKRL